MRNSKFIFLFALTAACVQLKAEECRQIDSVYQVAVSELSNKRLVPALMNFHAASTMLKLSKVCSKLAGPENLALLDTTIARLEEKIKEEEKKKSGKLSTGIVVHGSGKD